jgi:glycosyltransferase involved in cell wall biosynthesis
MPVFNEVHTLEKIMDRILDLKIDKEIIIVDDYSTDGSKEILKQKYSNNPLIKIIFHTKNLGKGAAVKTAIRYASSDYSIIQDADLEYNPEDFLAIIDLAAEQNADVVYGSRFLKTSRVTSRWHFLVNKTLTVLSDMLYGAKLTDMETCYKLIKTDIFKKIGLDGDRFEIDAEITAKLLRSKYKIVEVPISYKGRSYHEGKKITWKDGLFTVWILLKYRFFR